MQLMGGMDAQSPAGIPNLIQLQVLGTSHRPQRASRTPNLLGDDFPQRSLSRGNGPPCIEAHLQDPSDAFPSDRRKVRSSVDLPLPIKRQVSEAARKYGDGQLLP